MKRWMFISVAFGLCLALAGVLYAQSVLQTDMKSAKQVVETRKFIMHAIVFNLKDIGAKVEAGKIPDIQANGASLVVAAAVLPPLYKDKLESAYNGQGKYFKGAAPAEFEAAAEMLRASAAQLQKSAEEGNADGVKQAMGGIQQSCKNCHSKYRGEF